jgi:hypothetical protein
MSIIFKNKSEITGTLSNASLNYSSIINLSRSDGYPFYIEGYINLSNMVSSDAITIREEIWINSSFINYETQNLSNAQLDDLLHFHSKYAPTGIYRLMMKQNYGTSRDFDYSFIALNVSTT